MIDFMYAEINVVGIVLLLLFLSNMNKNGHKKLTIDQRIFNACMIMNIFIFLFDTGMWLVDGKNNFIAVNNIVTTLYYISNPLICFLWLTYTDFKIYESRNGLLKRIRFYAIPCAINAVLSMISPFTNWLFIINEQNIYNRGPYFWVMALIALFYLVLACGISIKDIINNGWEENKNINRHLVAFPILIIIASLIQIMFYGISIIWTCCMLASASIYINIQNGHISTDHLTGLYNRRRLDEHLQRRIKMRKKDHLLYAIMLDLDNFKKINDIYGHAAGDCALVAISEILRQACKSSDDFIARMGGDEFIIVGERKKIDDIKHLTDKISSGALVFNENGQQDYVLQPSLGYSIFYNGDTIDSFLAKADHEMYQNKQKRKLVGCTY